jgi:hypothetical protein
MNRPLIRLFALVALVLSAAVAAQPQESAFSYQGRLEQNGVPANGNFDFTFALFAAASGGTAIGSPLSRPDVAVDDGLFTVELDFGSTAFDGSQRFLQVTVNGTTLAPRTAIGTTPYASVALTALDASMAQSVPWRGATQHVVAPATEVTEDEASWFSVVIGADGLPFVAYYAIATLDLKLARCLDAVCSSVSSITVDSAGDVGDFNDIALGTDERPVISYYDRTNGDLKLARCSDRQCTGVTTRTLDTLGNTGQFTSITAQGGQAAASTSLNKRGPLIAYYDASNDDLRYLQCNDPDCTSPSGLALDSVGDVGQWADIVFDGTRVQVAYQDTGNGRLKLAVCSSVTCSSVTVRTLDSAANSGFAPSLALTPAGRALVSHSRFNGSNNELALVRCNTASGANYCDAPLVSNLGSTFSTGLRPTQLLMRHGTAPMVWDGQFRIHPCEDLFCSVVGASTSAVGVQSTLTLSRSAATIGADGLPLLLTQGGGIDGTPRGIRATHCANATCNSHDR